MRGALTAALVVLAAASPADAETVADLYSAETIVTGETNLAERKRGLRETLGRVIVKVSGDARLADDPRLAGLQDQAPEFVSGFAYEDRKKGIQISDEQGTRDRSFFFRVAFVPERIDTAIRGLGGRPWGTERPRTLVVLGIEDLVGRYVLGRESARGYGQREAVRSARRRLGLPLVLPRLDAADQDSVGFGTLDTGATALAGRYGADAVLAGTMAVTPDGYWETAWTLQFEEETYRWTTEPATFDRAIAAGAGRAARIMAGIE